MLRKITLLVIALCLFATTALAGAKLRVAVEDFYPPYSSEDENGQMVGFNVDIAEALAKEMGMSCEIISVAWDDMLPRLVAGDYDTIVACMAIKPERLEFADFTDYYLRSKTGFIGRKGMSDNTSPVDMAGKTLASQSGTAQLAYLEKAYGKESTVKSYPTMEEAFIAAATGEADLALAPLLAGLEFLKGDKGKDCDIIGPALTDEQYPNAPAYIAVKKGNTALQQKLNKALRAIRINGEYAIISRKYFPFSVY